MVTNQKNGTVAHTQELGLLVSLALSMSQHKVAKKQKFPAIFRELPEFSIRKNYF